MQVRIYPATYYGLFILCIYFTGKLISHNSSQEIAAQRACSSTFDDILSNDKRSQDECTSVHLSCGPDFRFFPSRNFFHRRHFSARFYQKVEGVNWNNIIDNRDTFRNLPRGKLNVTLFISSWLRASVYNFARTSCSRCARIFLYTFHERGGVSNLLPKLRNIESDGVSRYVMLHWTI